MDSAESPVTGDPVAAAIDGASADWSVSGDAMRWTPEVAREGSRWSELPGLDAAVGLGAGIGLDLEPVRRLVAGALTSFGAVAGEVVAELRELTRGAFPDDGTPPEGGR